MFINQAFAETTSAVSSIGGGAMDGSSPITSMIPLLLILVVFYMMVIRPQNKRMQDHRSMISGLQKGDKVVTGGGLIGKVKKTVGDDELVIEIADSVDVHVLRSTVMMTKDKPCATACNK